MIIKTLKTLTGKLTLSIPSQLSEVSLGQMMALQEHPKLTDLDAISILSGIAVADLQNVKDATEFVFFADAVLELSQQITYLYNSDVIPKSITLIVDDKPVVVKVISNLSVEPAGAFMAARDVITDEIAEYVEKYGETDWQQHFNPSLAACCKVLAYYFYCKATGKPYDEYAAADFTETIKTLGVTEALPIAKHFFTRFPHLSRPRTGFWQRLLRPLRKEPVYSSLRSLDISIP